MLPPYQWLPVSEIEVSVILNAALRLPAMPCDNLPIRQIFISPLSFVFLFNQSTNGRFKVS